MKWIWKCVVCGIEYDNDKAPPCKKCEIGTRWLDMTNRDCYEKTSWGWKYIGITSTYLPFPEIEITELHEKDIKEKDQT